MKKTAETSTLKTYLEASATLALFKASLVPITQPLQVIMRMQQHSVKSPRLLSALAAFKQVRSTGVANLMRGTVPALLKEGLKNGTYKAAFLKGSPDLVTAIAPWSMSSWNSHPYLAHISIALASAGIASAADTLIGGPLERFATYRATSQGSNLNANFLDTLREKSFVDQVREIWKGAGAMMFKTGIACATLYSTGKPIQAFITQKNQLKPGDSMPLTVSAQCALATGFSVAMMSSPFDIVKTIKQAPDSSKKGLAALMRENVARHGLTGLTAGLPIKILMTCLGWAAVSAITQSKTVPDPEDAFYHFTPYPPTQ